MTEKNEAHSKYNLERLISPIITKIADNNVFFWKNYT